MRLPIRPFPRPARPLSPVVAVAAACALPAVLLGCTPVLTEFTAHAGAALVPSALGAPFALPALRVVPLGSTGWAAMLCEDFAVVALVAVAALRMRRHMRLHPRAGRARRALAAWTALIAAGAAAGLWRGLVMARMTEAGPAGWPAYAAAGAALGALWGTTLGWLPAASTWAGRTSGSGRDRGGDT
ncbi:hypothetical protein [Streptomyces sp. NPDC048111]|uniref:hypothetical protein n=1 Tax=Streptomyces sp. NPDC048111 TaxID=3365500 RepID=UPI00371F7697